MTKNYYELLGIPQDAGSEQIESAYQQAYKRLLVSENPRTIKKRNEVAEAYQVLSDPERRRNYDRQLSGEEMAQPLTSEDGGTSMEKKIVGIDLGTTYSAIAHLDEYGKPELISNAEGKLLTPSVILFEDDTIIVGGVAKQMARAEPEMVMEYVKRYMGKPKEHDDPSQSFSREFYGQTYSADELSACILRKLKEDAEAYLNQEITDAVITVPAYFKDPQRSATINAGKIAGLNVLRVINEPTAAAVSFGVEKQDEDQTVFVFDLGGGTFDVTIMQIGGNRIQMLGTDGDHQLGGKDWDDQIIEYVAQQFELEHGSDPLDDNQSYQDLQLRAVEAKESLSRLKKTRILCSHAGMSANVELTRDKFEELTGNLVESCRMKCEAVLSDTNLTWDDIDTILLVGGSTKMPMIRELLEEISGKSLGTEVHPDQAVALGAALMATLVQLEEDDKTGTQTVSDDTKRMLLGPSGKPIEVTDVISGTLGIVVWNEDAQKGEVVPMIPKNTQVPFKKTDAFGTVEANQPNVLIRIMEGEGTDPESEDVKELGTCLVPLPSGLPKGSEIEVTYEYTKSEILEVTGKAPDGKVVSVEIDRSGLSQEEVEAATQKLTQFEVV